MPEAWSSTSTSSCLGGSSSIVSTAHGAFASQSTAALVCTVVCSSRRYRRFRYWFGGSVTAGPQPAGRMIDWYSV